MKPVAAWNCLGFFAILFGISALLFYHFDPASVTHDHSVSTAPRSTSKLLDTADRTKKASLALIDEKIWPQSADGLGGTILAQLSQDAEKRKLQVTDFRFDKTVTVDGVREAPFTLMVEGEFAHVMEFIRGIENPVSKFGVGMVQIGTSDVAVGAVRATLRLTCFIRGEA